ncbi:MAG: site-2 protease family protein [Clostridia bacterium]|nr:site-2 protease family protein [Clostridia bacterium]
MIVLYILLALLVFGAMIFFHELGHFTFAKIFKVAINEFSLGMGPKVISKKGKDGVTYSLRLFPIGGYVSMAGEDEESDDPNAYDKKPAYQRFIIVVAGATMNILIAIVIVFLLTLTTSKFGTTIVAELEESSNLENSLMVGDEIVKVGKTSVSTIDELSYEIMYNGYEPLDITVIRNDEKIVLKDVQFPTFDQDGETFGKMNFKVKGEGRSFTTVIKNTFHTSLSTIRMIWDSLFGLLTGRFGINQVSGPIGVTGAMVEVVQYGPRQFFYMVAVISMNLGVFNLLPIPALDGGTLLFTGIEMIFKKRLPQKVEHYIKFIGLVLLLALVVFVSIKDVITLIL